MFFSSSQTFDFLFCLIFQPNIGRLGTPHGPSAEKVAVVAVDDCDIAVAIRFRKQIGNYSCAAQGTQTGQKKYELFFF